MIKLTYVTPLNVLQKKSFIQSVLWWGCCFSVRNTKPYAKVKTFVRNTCIERHMTTLRKAFGLRENYNFSAADLKFPPNASSAPLSACFASEQQNFIDASEWALRQQQLETRVKQKEFVKTLYLIHFYFWWGQNLMSHVVRTSLQIE